MMAIVDEPRALQNTTLKTMSISERAPHRTSRPDQPHISASQLKSYSGCPLAWRLSRTYRPEHVSASLVFGSAFHAAAERFYQMRLEGQSATLQDLMEAYDANWLKRSGTGDGKSPPPVKYSAKAGSAGELRETAGRMLEAFLAHASANVGEVIAVEEEFLVPMVPGLPALKGRIDMVEIRTDKAGDRCIHVVDFKTSAKRMSLDDIDRDQMDLYAMAVRQTGLLHELQLPLALRIDVVTKTKISDVTPITIQPDARNEKRVIAKAREIWKAYQQRCPNAPLFTPEFGEYLQTNRIHIADGAVRMVRELFSVEAACNAVAHEHVPGMDDKFAFDTETAKAVLSSLVENDRILLVGPTGSGKSSLIAQLASRLNWPLRRINLHGETGVSDFIGQHKARGG